MLGSASRFRKCYLGSAEKHPSAATASEAVGDRRRLEARMTRQQDILELLRAHGALCIGAICASLPISRGTTRTLLRAMERAGLVVIDEVGRRKVSLGYSDGALVKLVAGDTVGQGLGHGGMEAGGP